VVYGLIVPKDAVGGDGIQLVGRNQIEFTQRLHRSGGRTNTGTDRPPTNPTSMFAERIANELLAGLQDKAQASMHNRPQPTPFYLFP